MKTTKGTAVPVTPIQEPMYDLEGLQTDFPTARELEKFVFDQTGYTLHLKGRSNKFKYETAMAVLNGAEPDPALLTGENPYVDKNDIVPSDPMKILPPRPYHIRSHIPVAQFQCDNLPHPDKQWQATGQKCSALFRKYIDNTITCEILGPIAQRPVGMRINKYGKDVPDKYEWVDPRNGEEVIVWPDGTITPRGTRLRNFMSNPQHRIGNKSQWETWIDRDFVIGGDATQSLDNPWD